MKILEKLFRYISCGEKQEIALKVIEAVCEDHCMSVHSMSNHPKDCFACKIYGIAHSASRTCQHKTWWKQTRKLYQVLGAA